MGGAHGARCVPSRLHSVALLLALACLVPSVAPARMRRLAHRSGARARGVGSSMRMYRLALYVGEGTSGSRNNMHREISKALSSHSWTFEIDNITENEVKVLAVGAYDAVIFPGGSGLGQKNAIGDRGILAVKAFVQNGGGFLGVCGGAFLALESLKLFGMIRPKKPWARGQGIVKLAFTEKGIDNLRLRELAMYQGEVNSSYAQGPILYPENIPASVEILASFTSEVSNSAETRGQMVDTPAITSGVYGSGLVVVSSVHPEIMPYRPELLFGFLAWILRASPAAREAAAAAPPHLPAAVAAPMRRSSAEATLLVTEALDDGKYFSLDPTEAKAFFGTNSWSGKEFMTETNGKVGKIMAWRTNSYCGQPCGRRNPLSAVKRGDWKKGDAISLKDSEDEPPEIVEVDRGAKGARGRPSFAKTAGEDPARRLLSNFTEAELRAEVARRFSKASG